MLSKIHKSNAKPVAFDTGDEQLVFYSKSYGNKQLDAVKEFNPWWFGDALVYVCGRRGSGKSTYCNQYIKSYTEATDGKVFFVSRFEDDPSIDLPERSMRIPISSLGDFPISDLQDSLIVFDDIHNAGLSPAEQKYLQSYILDVMENSRHFNLSCLITSHMVTNYSKTRAILNECSALVVFPSYSNNYQIERALKLYFGLSKIQIAKIMAIENSRWVQVQTIQPKFILTQKEIYTYE
jgi:energy-coupling factor transporter ATP-binding protein EcfA2